MTAGGWEARLALRFERREQRTVLTARRHLGPLTVQRPFYPEGEGCCHVYLLHPPGGVVGGDSLQLEVETGAGAHALLTTPAAAKFYRSSGAVAWQGQTLKVAPGALLEWLPQETIVFDGAQVENLTRVELTADARFIGWEVLCLGRPASGDLFFHGQLRQRFEVWREGRPLLLERGRWQGGDAALQARWGLQGKPVLGTMVVTGRFDALLPSLQEGLATLGEGFALSQLPELLVLRYLGDDAQQARNGFTALWERLRPQMAGRAAVIPRIWNT